MYVYIYIYTYTYKYLYRCIHVYICICVHVPIPPPTSERRKSFSASVLFEEKGVAKEVEAGKAEAEDTEEVSFLL
jgi:hypothetical protein